MDTDQSIPEVSHVRLIRVEFLHLRLEADGPELGFGYPGLAVPHLHLVSLLDLPEGGLALLCQVSVLLGGPRAHHFDLPVMPPVHVLDPPFILLLGSAVHHLLVAELQPQRLHLVLQLGYSPLVEVSAPSAAHLKWTRR